MISFLTTNQVVTIHDSQLAEHGGVSGIGDIAVIDSIVTRVEHLLTFEKQHDLFIFAAAYLRAFARGHCFTDANKRTGLLSALVFLSMNDIDITSPPKFADYVMEVAQDQHDLQAVAKTLRKLAGH